jgi:PIN domain nuclease of toxin-antitoxin system
VRVLLDTCAYLIATHQPDALPAKARKAILQAQTRYWSPVGTWEIAVKSILGRLDFPHEAFSNLEVGLLALCTTPLPLTHAHAFGVHALPAVHRDPFDRLLIAQAAAEGLTLITADEMIPRYPGIRTLW